MKKIAMYMRLSREDEYMKDESNSIKNQRKLLRSHIKKIPEFAGKEIIEIKDDGYTGKTMDRPGMQDLLSMVKRGQIEAILCKDLSRFSRDYLTAGQYLEKIFPFMGVRFISVGDDYDSINFSGGIGEIDVAFKEILYDYYSVDLSEKIRSSLIATKRTGKHQSYYVPYGYCKDPNDKYQVMVDEEAAAVVKDIFAKKMSGYSASAIANELNETGVLSPAEYKKAMGYKYRPGFCRGRRSLWSAQSVIRVLKNEVYAGTLAQGKSERISYKVRKQVEVPPEEWIRCDNAHEALVSRFVFDTVQMLMDRDTICAKGSRMSRLYNGMLFCADCGCAMVRRTNPRNPNRAASYICGAKNVQGTCSRHAIREDRLNEAVFSFIREYVEELSDVKAVTGAVDDEDGSVDLGRENGSDASGCPVVLSREEREMERLREELKQCAVFKGALYQDLQRGIINERQFQRFREKYTKREAQLEEIIRRKEQYAKVLTENREELDRNLREFREQMNISVVDRNLLVMLVERIMVHEGGEIEVVTRFGRGE